MSLLHGVLRPTNPRDVDVVAARLKGLSVPDDSPSSSRNPSRVTSPTPGGNDTSDDDDYELIGVVSAPGTPRRLASRSTSRSTSPTRLDRRQGAASRQAPGPLILDSAALTSKAKSKTDPVRVLTTDLTQRVFSQLDVKDLAGCSRVCLKWNKSQSLNYIWYLQNRKLEFGDSVLPTGKWTRGESKENWRRNYMRTARNLAESDINSTSRYGYSNSAPASGRQTPREMREDKWAAENGGETGLSKVELRGLYKDLGGRKARTKNKVGANGARDRGGWEDAER